LIFTARIVHITGEAGKRYRCTCQSRGSRENACNLHEGFAVSSSGNMHGGLAMSTPNKQLTRDNNDVMIGGVASGIARYLDIDALIVRLIFVVLAFNGIGVLMYLILWVLMPRDAALPATQVKVADGDTQKLSWQSVADNSGESEQEIPIQNVGGAARGASGAAPDTRGVRVLGWVMIAIGGLIATKMLLPFLAPLLVPLLLVGAGVYLIYRAR
jgi:phage shock protein PspC (stress-responsive transcriptional regulator)